MATRRAQTTKPKRNMAGYRDALGVFHPIRSGMEQRTTRRGTKLVESKIPYNEFLSGDFDDPATKRKKRERYDDLKGRAGYAEMERQAKQQKTIKRGHSLAQFVRRRGGIAPSKDGEFSGEMARLGRKESGTTGLINQHNKQGNHRVTADLMMEAANEAHYRTTSGRRFANIGDFLMAVADDASGTRKLYSYAENPSPRRNAATQRSFFDSEATSRARPVERLQRVEDTKTGEQGTVIDRFTKQDGEWVKVKYEGAGRAAFSRPQELRAINPTMKKKTTKKSARRSTKAPAKRAAKNPVAVSHVYEVEAYAPRRRAWVVIGSYRARSGDGAINQAKRASANHRAEFTRYKAIRRNPTTNGFFGSAHSAIKKTRKAVARVKDFAQTRTYKVSALKHKVVKERVKFPPLRAKSAEEAIEMIKQGRAKSGVDHDFSDFRISGKEIAVNPAKPNGWIGRVMKRGKASRAYRRRLRHQAATTRAEAKRKQYEEEALENPATTRAPKPTKKTLENFREFQGRDASGMLKVNASHMMPAGSVNGALERIKLKGRDEMIAPSKSHLIADHSKRLWISERLGKRNLSLGKDQCTLEGDIEYVVYRTQKAHLGDKKLVSYIHHLGEETGAHPQLFLDREGYGVIKGGEYTQDSRGIIN